MTGPLPPSIENYFSGKNARDFATAVSGFSPSARVQDEGRSHEGPAAIRAWIEETAAKYDDRAEVESFTRNDDGVEVVAQVSGTFLGSPIPLRFAFTLDGDRISRLEIAP